MRISIETIAEVDSTNTGLIRRIANDGQMAEGMWLVADRQSAGRGRQGRRWLDAPGNFMGSTAIRVKAGDPAIATLSFVAGLALYETLIQRLSAPAGLMLKWPNDVMLDGAKLAGILLEREGDYAIVGMGVNLATAPLIDGRAVKAMSDKGPAPARDAFANDIALQLELEVRRWRESGFAPIRNRWLAAAHAPGTRVAVHQPDGNILHGKFDGIGEDGALELRLADGMLCVIRAGDVMLDNG